MDTKVCISLAILALVLAGPETTRAAAFAGGTASIDMAAAVHRRILADPGLGSGVYNANNAACGSQCAGHGKRYTGRGCDSFYGCRSKPP
ncbi:hypothetical protein D1007_27940 [Hordeum vulgare]|uniref:Predicted protein n=1 Tax=Hordeum vulgare subsp. vulgare TaxID=112509 RepID=F2CZ71_HORVV|nr:uncharacterized protein LOC123440958 [Hordeum vulgare subsp. vulgare]KAE8796988.1 hypothetical protein D1007_27940 [Hordeum vulgare]BAJ88142.1 predicted protein [Hordeum vulgare subsp. vulgare]